MEASVAELRRAPAVDTAAEIERESMRIRCRQSLHSLPSMAVVFAVTGALLWGGVPAWRLLAWLGLCLAMTALRAGYCARVLPRIESADGARLARLEAGLFATVLTNTLAMGSGMWWVAAAGDIEVQYFVTLVVCLYSVGALVNASSHVPSFVAGVATNVGQAALFWVAQGLDGVKIAVPLAVIGLLLAGFARANAHAFADSIRMRFRNLDLLAELAEEKRAVEHALSLAQEASQSKSRFLAAASHDLRQPLHALKLQIGAISLQPGTEAVRGWADKSLAMVDSLDELFRNLLDLSRMDAGALKPRLQVFPVGELFSHLEAEFALLAREKGLRFEMRADPARVQSDLLLVERLLRNLLSNAIRYTEKGSVTLAARAQGGEVLVSVADSGPGIAPEHRQRIFEEFVQVGGGASGGVGLGLAIARRIDALLGLALELESEPGRGSVFRLRLPAAAPLP